MLGPHPSDAMGNSLQCWGHWKQGVLHVPPLTPAHLREPHFSFIRMVGKAKSPRVEFTSGEEDLLGPGQRQQRYRRGRPCLAPRRGSGLDALRTGPCRPGLDVRLCETGVTSSEVMDASETAP